jgi:hypothetical protein
MLRQSGIAAAEESLQQQKGALEIMNLRAQGHDKEADALERELKLQRDIANAISNQYLEGRDKKEEAKGNLEAMAAAEKKARDHKEKMDYESKAAPLDAEARELEQRYKRGGEQKDIKTLEAESLAAHNALGGLFGNEYREQYNKFLRIENEILDRKSATQKEIASNTERAAQLKSDALAKELTGQQQLNKMTTEYWELQKKIAEAKGDPAKQAALGVEQAEVFAKAAGAKKQVERDKEEAAKDALAAKKNNEEKALEDAKARLKKAIAPGEATLEIARGMADGSYSPQGRASARAQQRAEDSIIKRAAREKAKKDYGKDWQKLNEAQRQEATRIRIGQVGKAAAAEKLMATIDPDAITELTAAIEKLIAK